MIWKANTKATLLHLGNISSTYLIPIDFYHKGKKVNIYTTTMPRKI